MIQESKTVSRREFLKIAGLAGATVGLGAGLGGLLAACGGGTTSTTAATTATTATSSTSTSGVETTVSTAAEAGREIKVGFVAALTGGLATFGVADQWCLERWNKAIGDGMILGDGKKHPITITMSDSQSDSNRAAQVAGDLIQNSKVDVIMATSTPEIVNPVADQAEAMQCPCVTVDTPGEAFVFGRGGAPDKPFKWTYHLFWGFSELTTVVADVFGQIPTNKVIGGIWPNNTDGNAFRDAFTAKFKDPGSGFTLFDAGPYNEPNEDFTSIIGSLKKAGCEILTSCQIPPDFNNFWSQCKQQGLNPKIFDGSKATLFPEAVESYGERSLNLVSGVWWHPSFPYKSSLSGETCQQIADGFETETGKQWTSPLTHYIVFEAAVNALQRTKDLDDKEAIIEAVSTIKVDTISGPIDFTAPAKPGTKHPFVNVVSTPLCYGQWVKGTKWPWEIVIISNAAGAANVQVQAKEQPLPI